jgi:hypothetical protein
MAIEAIPFHPKENNDLFRGVFMVPGNWTSCGMVVHVSGGKDLESSQPVALAVTQSSLSFCDQEGPLTSILFQSIKSVQVVDITGISLPVNTPSGFVDMVPSVAKGVSITYQHSPMGTMELILYMFTPKAAFEWVNVIQRAIQNNFDVFDSAGGISHR